MKALRKHWLQGTSKVLSAAIALLGLAGCGTSKRAVDPPVVMYGAPYEGTGLPDTTQRRSPKGSDEMRLMYGVAPVQYETVDPGFIIRTR